MSQTKAQLIDNLVQALNFTSTASAPANGAFLSAANTLALATNSTQRLTIDSTGRVVIGNTTVTDNAKFQQYGTSARYQSFQSTNGDLAIVTDNNSNPALYIKGTGTADLVNIFDNTTEVFTILDGGNVGIGTTSPSQKLHISSGTASGALQVQSNGSNNYFAAVQSTGDFVNGSSAGSLVIRSQGGIHFTGNDGASVQATLTSGGNLGIGTTSPITKLDVNGDIRATTHMYVGDSIFHIADTNTRIRFPADDTFTIETAGSERMRINSSGNLLIGNTSSRDLGGLSSQRLAIEGTSGNAAIGIINNQNSGGFASLRFAKSRGTSVGSNTVVQSGDPLGGIVFCGADGTDMASVGAQILAEVDGTPGSNDMPGRLEFFTTADGAASPTERMRIDKGGRIMFNMTSPLDTIAGSLNLSGGGSGGRIAFQGTSSSAGAGIAEIFAHWGTNKVAGMIALSGADTTNKDDGQLLFYTSSAGPAVTERMRIDSAGNVGIGTSSPITKLEIENGSDLDNILVVRGADASTEYAGVGVTGGNAIFTAGGVGSTSAGMVFRTASGGVETERARIDSAGRLVVGSNSAFTNLGFSSSAAIQAIGAYNVGSIASVNNEANGNTCAVTSAKIRGTNAVNNGDVVGSHAFDGYDGGTFRTIARIDGVVSSAVSSNSISGELRFRTRDGSTQAERMRIDKDGHVYIGTTAKDPGLTNTFGSFIDPQGYIAISGNGATAAYFNRSSTTGVIVSYRYNGTQRGALETDGTVIALTGTSDYRLKENQVTISDGITRLKQLKPYRFNFKETPSKTIDGFFAHEVNSVVPEAVFGEKDAVATEADTQSGYTLGEIKPQRVDQSKLVPLLTAALQEEISKREALEARVAALEAA